jgi:hypothetical protein
LGRESGLPGAMWAGMGEIVGNHGGFSYSRVSAGRG